MTSSDELAQRIRLGEDSTLERKRVVLNKTGIAGPSRDDLADELAAFANGHGGTVLLGIDDKTREVIGIPPERLDEVERWIRDLCNDAIKPPIHALIRKAELAGPGGAAMPVICIDVPRSLFIHRSPGGYFRRLGSSKREMPPDVLARLFQERSQSRVIHFDESPVPGSAFEDLDAALAGRFLRDGADWGEAAARKLRLIVRDSSGAERATVAGVLMATRAPQRWLSFAEIQAVAYAGERSDRTYQLDARDIGGPLDQQILDALHFVRRNMTISAIKVTGRVETPQFSERAVFEALVNAVAHRDYSMDGARIQLHIFRDRLELHVPGGLANTLTTDSLHLRQYNRNELVVSLLARCPVGDDASIGRSLMMDRRGDGVPIIYEESKRLSGRRPEYRVVDESELQLTIWSAAAAV